MCIVLHVVCGVYYIALLQTVLPVKRAASHTLCVLIRNNRRQQQRKELISWIIKG